jgi:hypothetical protein
MSKTVVFPVVIYDVKLGLSSGERTYIEGDIGFSDFVHRPDFS